MLRRVSGVKVESSLQVEVTRHKSKVEASQLEPKSIVRSSHAESRANMV